MIIIFWRIPSYQMPRTQCEFRGCPCRKHVGGPNQICGICMHAACWHKIDKTQFKSTRPAARKPVYFAESVIRTPKMPQVPPLPDEDIFCPTVIGLPV